MLCVTVILLLLHPASCLAAVAAAPSSRLGNLTVPAEGAPWPRQFTIEPATSRWLPRLPADSAMINILEVTKYIADQKFTDKFDFGPSRGSPLKSRTFRADGFSDVAIHIEDASNSLENRFAIWGMYSLVSAQAYAGYPALRIDIFWTENGIKKPLGRISIMKDEAGYTAGNVSFNPNDPPTTDDSPVTILPIVRDEKTTATPVDINHTLSSSNTELRAHIRSFGKTDLSIGQLAAPACGAMLGAAGVDDKEGAPGLIQAAIPRLNAGLWYSEVESTASRRYWSYRAATQGLVLMAREFVALEARKEVTMELSVGGGGRVAIAKFEVLGEGPPPSDDASAS